MAITADRNMFFLCAELLVFLVKYHVLARSVPGRLFITLYNMQSTTHEHPSIRTMAQQSAGRKGALRHTDSATVVLYSIAVK